MRVTVAVGRKNVALEDVKNAQIVTALRQAAKDIGTRLAAIKCPEHEQGATDIRLHFDAGMNGDLKYHSCCQKLGDLISKVV